MKLYYILFFVQLAQCSVLSSNDDIMDRIEEKLSQLLDAKLAALKTTVFDGKTMSILLEEKMGQFHEKINVIDDRLTEVESSMKEKLTEVESNMKEKLTEVESRIDDRLIEVGRGIDSRLTEVEGSINGRITEVESSIDGRLPEVGSSINGSLTAVDSPISKKLTCIEEAMNDLNAEKPRPRNCDDIFKQGVQPSESVQIYPYFWSEESVYEFCAGSSDESVFVICEGSSTVIQQRKDMIPREDFARSWGDYETGFGSLTGEFWIGLKLIHKLTQQAPQELHITLEDWEGETRFAKYQHFSVAGPEDNYRLNVTGYSGDAGDALSYYSNGNDFTTTDRDNDVVRSINCAFRWGGGWWHHDCGGVNLNGRPLKGSDTGSQKGINWNQWRSLSYSLKATTMKIRPSGN